MAFIRHHDTGTRTSPRGERTGVVRPTLTEEWLLIKPPNPENFSQFPYCRGRPLENQRGSDMVVGFGESRRRDERARGGTSQRIMQFRLVAKMPSEVQRVLSLPGVTASRVAAF